MALKKGYRIIAIPEMRKYHLILYYFKLEMISFSICLLFYCSMIIGAAAIGVITGVTDPAPSRYGISFRLIIIKVCDAQ